MVAQLPTPMPTQTSKKDSQIVSDIRSLPQYLTMLL